VGQFEPGGALVVEVREGAFLRRLSVAARAMMALWRMRGRADSGTSEKVSAASTLAAVSAIHSGGLSQRSRRSFSSAAAALIRWYAGWSAGSFPGGQGRGKVSKQVVGV